MNCSTPGLPIHHQLPKFTETNVHRVGDAIQPSHPLSSPSPPAFSLSQHHSLFKWVSSPHQVVKVLEFQLQHQSFQWTARTDLLYDGLVGSHWVQGTLESSLTPQFKNINSLALFIDQLSHPYMTPGKTIALIGQTFVGKVTSLLFNMLSRLVITFLPRSKCLVISWLQSPSAVILEPKNIKSLTISITSPSLCHLSKRSYILVSHAVDMGGHCATQCRAMAGAVQRHGLAICQVIAALLCEAVYVRYFCLRWT